ncbi:MAG: DUF805 domain-containing protein [Dongiaceae bacterium]
MRRPHDSNKPRWRVLPCSLPIIGWVWLVIECGLPPSQKGHNRYGPEPGE